jgi:putative alpha-1,2-mannosidase
MLSFYCSVALVAVLAVESAEAGDCPAYDSTNVFIATSGFAYGYGSVSPAAQVPYGAMRLGPDTVTLIPDAGFRHNSGYNFADKSVRAFSHTV